MKPYLLAVLLMSVSLDAAFCQERDYARSMVLTTRGVVATSQTLASQAGAQVLARGGSAADAAIAANAVLTVVEPMMNGIGGDLFAIVREARGGRIVGLNASGPAPRGQTIQLVKDAGHLEMPDFGIHSVTVPGCVRGWAELHARYGKLKWEDLFQPAIYYAANGFPVTEIIAAQWEAARNKLPFDEEGAKVFLPGGAPPRVGGLFRNPAYARALRAIARQGPDVFYRGEIAHAIVEKSRKLEGTLAPEDLASFRAEWVKPISTNYRGWRVWELPPNSQGMAALSMLNLMEHFVLSKMSPFDAQLLHIEIEAQKLAYADLQRYLADPRMANIPVDQLLFKPYAAQRVKLIDLDKANCAPSHGNPALPSEGDTVYLAAADAQGNLVSLIQSVFLSFGSAIIVPGYGFHLHNRGGLFTFDEGHPNALAPGKRPFHTIIPALMERGSQAIAFGIMGGLNQAQAHAQFVSRVADHGMNIQQALETPRFTRLKFDGCEVRIENRVPAEAIEALRAKGHEVRVIGAYSQDVGGGQAVMYDSMTRVKAGASSPRKDGAAIPEPDRYFSQP